MIGIIDSGYGGLSLVAELSAQQKQVPFVYIGDNARNPYGTKTKSELVTYGKELIDYLVTYDPQIQTIIIACNTLCAAALPELMSEYPHLVIDPITRYGARDALMSFNKHVSVMGTTFTVASNIYAQLIQAYDEDITVQQIDAQAMVTMVETQHIDDDKLVSLFQEIDAQSDTLIYGCTHFPFLYDFARQVVPEHIQIIDPAVSCVAQLPTPPNPDWQSSSRYLTTGSVPAFKAFVQANNLTDLPIEKIILGHT